MSTEPSSRAAEVLERLARTERHRGSLGATWERLVGSVRVMDERDVEAHDAAADAGTRRTGEHSDPKAPVAEHRRPRRPWRGMLLAVAIVAVVALVLVERRPAPIEQRLPMAASTTAESGGGSTPRSGSTAEGESDAERPGADEPEADGPGAADTGEVVVHVAGAVTRPGVVRLPASSRAVDAVTAAGGLRPDADADRVNLAAGLVDGQRVVVPAIGQPAPVEAFPPPAAPTGSSPGSGEGPSALVDLNTADAALLEELPGVGPATAGAILAHRDENGPFASVDALIDVRGIGEAKLEAVRDLVTVAGGR